jgi:YVTN family beta-propeller protein
MLNNLYSETRSVKLSPVVAKHLSRVYVPNRSSNDVWVIDPESLKVVDKFKVGVHPQHVVPSWDLKTLWVNNNAEGRTDGSVTPIDPLTGKPGKNIPVDDPYNMYFTPNGDAAIIVAEARKRLDFRDPHTMAMKYSIDTPQCAGIQSRRFLHRWPLRHIYLRVRQIAREDRFGRKESRWLSKIIQGRHAARRAHRARRQGFLRRRT